MIFRASVSPAPSSVPHARQKRARAGFSSSHRPQTATLEGYGLFVLRTLHVKKAAGDPAAFFSQLAEELPIWLLQIPALPRRS